MQLNLHLLVMYSLLVCRKMSAFTVFLDHWMKEENRAKRLQYYRTIGPKIQGALQAKVSLLLFEELLQAWQIPGLQSPELLGNIRFRAMVLVMFQAVSGECERCMQSVVRFEVHRQIHLMAICQNERCAHVQFFFEELFMM